MGPTALAGAALAGAGLVAVYFRFRSRAKTPSSIKLTYFDISAAPGEKIRLALNLSGIAFTDNRARRGSNPLSRVANPVLIRSSHPREDRH